MCICVLPSQYSNSVNQQQWINQSINQSIMFLHVVAALKLSDKQQIFRSCPPITSTDHSHPPITSTYHSCPLITSSDHSHPPANQQWSLTLKMPLYLLCCCINMNQVIVVTWNNMIYVYSWNNMIYIYYLFLFLKIIYIINFYIMVT